MGRTVWASLLMQEDRALEVVYERIGVSVNNDVWDGVGFQASDGVVNNTKATIFSQLWSETLP